MKKMSLNNKVNLLSSASAKYKHLRGRHDQRDHAWNRGMGRGYTSGGYAPGTMNQEQFMEMKRNIQSQIDSGAMTYQVGSAIWKRAQELANQDYDTSRRDLARESISQSRVDSIQQGAIVGALSNRQFDSTVQTLKTLLEKIRNTYSDYLETQKAEERIAQRYATDHNPNPDPDFAYAEEYNDLIGNLHANERNLSLLISSKNFDTQNRLEMIREVERKFPYDYWKQNEELVRLNDYYDRLMKQSDEQIKETQKEIDLTLKTLKNNPVYHKREIVEPLEQEVLASYNEENVTPERLVEIQILRSEYQKAQSYLKTLEEETAKGKRKKLNERINSFIKLVNLTIDTSKENFSSSLTPAETMQRIAELAKQLRESPDTQTENNRKKLYYKDQPSQQYIDSLDTFLEVHIKFSQLANYFANAIEMMRQEARMPNEEGVIKWGAGESVVREIFKNLNADNPIPVNITESFQDPNELVGTRYPLDWRKEDVKDILSIVPDYSDVPYDVDFADYESANVYYERESASYRKDKGVIHQGRNTNFATLVHETLHLIQLRFPEMQQILNEWAFDRIQLSGETVRKLSEITRNSNYADNELSVVDSVDTPYTLKEYGNGKYNEVLTTAFDRLSDLKFTTQDPAHIRIALYALLRYLPVPSKTKSLKERLKHMRGRHDQLDHGRNQGGGGDGGSDGGSSVITAQQFDAMSRRLDQEVAAGVISQQIADLTKNNLRAKVNQNDGTSLGVNQISRRQRVMNKFSGIRSNVTNSVQSGFNSLIERIRNLRRPKNETTQQNQQEQLPLTYQEGNMRPGPTRTDVAPKSVIPISTDGMSEQTKQQHAQIVSRINELAKSMPFINAIQTAYSEFADSVSANPELEATKYKTFATSFGFDNFDKSGLNPNQIELYDSSMKDLYNELFQKYSDPSMDDIIGGYGNYVAKMVAEGTRTDDSIALSKAMFPNVIQIGNKYGNVVGEKAAYLPRENSESLPVIDTQRQQTQPFTGRESAEFVTNSFEMQLQRIKEQMGVESSPQAAFNVMTAIVQQLSQQEQRDLLNDPEAINHLDSKNLGFDVKVALSVFGDPEVRMDILRKARTEDPNFYENSKNYSTDYLLVEFEARQASGENLTAQDFADMVIDNHSAGKYVGGNSASFQQLFAYTGPNANVPRDQVRSFYPSGVLPPVPHPQAIQLMNEAYAEQQQRFADRGITHVTLYRGGNLHGGLPMESWSLSYDVAESFTGQVAARITDAKVETRVASIPVEYIFSTCQDSAGYGNFFGEQEFAVLASSMYENGTTDVRTDKNVAVAEAAGSQLGEGLPGMTYFGNTFNDVNAFQETLSEGELADFQSSFRALRMYIKAGYGPAQLLNSVYIPDPKTGAYIKQKLLQLYPEAADIINASDKFNQ